MNQRPRPSEPPLTGYTRNTSKRPRRFAPHWPSIISAASVLGISVTAVGIVLNDSPARGAADHAAVVMNPTATPGSPLPRKAPEYAPAAPDELPGDGMWIVGKQIKPGVYQSEAGALCYWERLSGLGGRYVDLIDNGGFRKGPTLVQVYVGDFAFSSQGCGKWVTVR